MSETVNLNDDFAYAVLSAVAEIPAGRVATYGQLAHLIGHPKNARLVARVLSHAEYYGDYPCHRVVSATGRLAPGWTAQAELLQAEGITRKDETHVSLQKYQWET